MFISSHLLGELSQMVDDVVVIGGGRLIAAGPIKDLLARASRAGAFVRTTLKNVTSGKVVDGHGPSVALGQSSHLDHGHPSVLPKRPDRTVGLACGGAESG